MNKLDLLSRITTHQNILDGRPAIRDKGISVEDVLGQLAGGDTVETLLSKHSNIELEDIQACLLYAKTLVQGARRSLSVEELADSIPKILDQAPYLTLLVLFGSRARGNSTPESDWDFAFLCDEEQRRHYEKGGWDSFRVWEVLQTAYDLADDEIDVVEIKNCSELIAHYIARDGITIYERNPGSFDQFRQTHLKNSEKLREFQQNLKVEIDRKLERLK